MVSSPRASGAWGARPLAFSGTYGQGIEETKAAKLRHPTTLVPTLGLQDVSVWRPKKGHLTGGHLKIRSRCEYPRESSICFCSLLKFQAIPQEKLFSRGSRNFLGRRVKIVNPALNPLFWLSARRQLVIISVMSCRRLRECHGVYCLHQQDYQLDFHYDFSNPFGNKLPTLTLPEIILGNSWLLESLQYSTLQIADILFTDWKWLWELFIGCTRRGSYSAKGRVSAF